jgi:hypothetical protein
MAPFVENTCQHSSQRCSCPAARKLTVLTENDAPARRLEDFLASILFYMRSAQVLTTMRDQDS